MKSCSEHKTSGGDTYAVVVYEADCGEPCPLCSANKELTDLEDKVSGIGGGDRANLADEVSALKAEIKALEAEIENRGAVTPKLVTEWMAVMTKLENKISALEAELEVSKKKEVER